MVAIFTGFGAGVERGSTNILGGAGQLGGSGIGRGGENVSVNAATGNLVISRRDEFLTGVGPDAAVSRSYNSLVHTSDRDNGDQWQQSTTRRIFAVHGTEDTDGSTVQRLGADGSVINYKYSVRDGELAYWAIDGAGAHDRLDFDGSRWTWTDGDSLTREVYEATVEVVGEYRLSELFDVNGQKLTYRYEDGSDRLHRIETQNGDWLEYTWNDDKTRITQIVSSYIKIDEEEVGEAAVGTRLYQYRSAYEYDAQGRLSQVTTDLTPEIGMADDHVFDHDQQSNDLYSINYQYVDATSNLVSKISQSDGSELSITYTADGRIETLTQKVARPGQTNPPADRVTSLAYHVGYTEVTGPDGTKTRLDYDAGGRLLQITTTAPQTGALPQIRQYEYDGDGNVIRVIEGEGNAPDPTALGGGLDVDAIDGGGATTATATPATFASTGRGENVVNGEPWPEDPNGAVPDNGTLPAGWTGWGRHETTWEQTTGPYAAADSNNTVALNLSNISGSANGGNAYLSERMTLDAAKSYEFTAYFQKDTDNDFRIRLQPGNGDSLGYASHGGDNPYPRFVDINTSSNNVFETGKWYKMVGYVLSAGTEPIGSTKLGGVYDIETGQKVHNAAAFIWSDNRTSDQLDIQLVTSHHTGIGESVRALTWKPEVREVTLDSAILTGDDTLDIATDAQLLGFETGQDTEQGGSGSDAAPGQYSPIGTINGAPTIVYNAASRETRFTYDENGNVVSTTDATGRTIINEYDDNNNLIRSSELFSDLLSHPREFLTSSYEGSPDAAIDLSSEWTINGGIAIQSTDGYAWSTVASREVITAQVGQIYTVSADVRIDNASFDPSEWSPFGLGFMTLDENFAELTNTSHWPSTEYTSSELLDNGWIRFEHAYKATAGDEFLRARFYRRPSLSGDGTISIRNFSVNSANVESTIERGWSRFSDITTKPLEALSHGAEGAPDEVPPVGDYWTFDNGVASKATGTNVWGGIGARELITAEAGKSYTVYADVKIDGAAYAPSEGAPVAIGFLTHDENFDRVSHEGLWPSASFTANELLDKGWVRLEYTFTATAGHKFLRPHFYQRDALGGDGTLSIRNFHVVPSYEVSAGRSVEQRRFVYDSHNRLRYEISAEGNVVEHRYNELGQLRHSIEYPEHLFTSTTPTLSLSEMDAWRDGLSDRSSTKIVRYGYDARGAMTFARSYGEATVSGDVSENEGISASYYTYDQTGQLIERHQRHEQSEFFVYDGLGRLVASTDLAGETTTIVFDDAETTTEITTSSGGATLRTFNKAGELVDQTTSGNLDLTGTSSYQYDSMGRLRVSTDETGNNSYYVYDAIGRKVADINHDGDVSEYRYDEFDQVVATTNYTNGLDPIQLAELANPENVLALSDIRPDNHSYDIWSWTIYDAKGLVIQSIDGEGGVSRFEYDGSDNLVRTTNYYNTLTDAQVGSFKATAPTSLILPTEHENDVVSRAFYDLSGRLVGALDGEGYLTETVYDAAGQKIEEIAYAQLTDPALRNNGEFSALRSSAAPSSPSNRSAHFVYDGQGQIRYTVDALGQVSSMSYNEAGRLVETTVHATAISEGDYTYDAVKAKVGAIANANTDRTSTTTYNDRGQVESTTDAVGLTTTFSYDTQGLVKKVVAGSGSDARTTRYWHSSQGVLKFSVDAEGYVKRYDYDNENRLTREISWSNKVNATDTTSNGDINSMASNAGSWTDVRYSYDTAGRRNSMYDGESNRTVWKFHRTGQTNSEFVGYTNNDGAATDRSRTFYGYDAAGRLAHKSLGFEAIERADTHYYYDGIGNISSVEDPNGNITTFTYDERGRVLTETNPEGGVTAYEYNAFGEVVKATDPRGNSTYSYYDSLGRVTHVVDAENHVTETAYTTFGEVESVTRYENRAGGMPTVSRMPSIVYEASQDATTTFAYDQAGRLERTTDAEGFVETYNYNAFGERISLTGKSETSNNVDGSDNITTYIYDKRGLLVAEVMPIAAYNSQGVPQSAKIGNAYRFDARGNRVEMIEALKLDGSETAIEIAQLFDLENTQAFDNAELSETRRTAYIYDDANRLIETRGQARKIFEQETHKQLNAAYVPKESIAYDARGNVSSTIDASGARTLFFYDDLNRKVVEIDALGTYTAYEYDKNSNVKRIEIFDAQITQSQLAGIGDGGAKGEAPSAPQGVSRVTEFDYDKLNRMSKSSVVFETDYRTGHFVDGSGWSNDETASLDTFYQYDANGNVVKTTDPEGNETFAYYDTLGRKTAQVDAEGYATKWTYDSEGNVLIETQAADVIANPIVGTVPNIASSGDDRITEYSYDEVGNRLTEKRLGIEVYDKVANNGTTIPLDGEVAYTYNGLGQVLTKTEATADVEGYRTADSITYAYDDGGRLEYEERSSFVGHTGTTVTPRVDYAYDGLGNLAQSVAAGAAGVAERVTRYEYNKGGLLSKTTDAQNNVREYFYDKSGRQIVEEYSRSGQKEASLTKFDLLGRVVEQKQARWDGPTNSWDVNSSSGADDGLTSQTEYNAFGDVTRAGVNGLWQTENKFDQAGRMWATNAGDGVWKFFGYDKNGNQTAAITTAGADLTAIAANDQFNFSDFSGDLAVTHPEVNGTYTVYDARNMAVQVREEGRQLRENWAQNLDTFRSYNAFGEVISETDARGSTLTYTYNTMGRMIRSESPVVSITHVDGSTQLVRPAEDFHYDLSGRLVAQQDANGAYTIEVRNENGETLHYRKANNEGNLTRLKLLAGTGYNGSEALVTQTIAEDGGIVRTAFDVHGDARKITDQIGRVMTKAYDDLGRVTEISHAGGLVEKMTYDSLGQVLTRQNNHYGPNNKQTTDYDLQGRVVSTRAFGGDITDTEYSWNAAISGIGLNTFGGWVQTTTYENTRTLVRHMDIYERETRKTDLSGEDTSYTYDLAGRLTGLTARTTTINYNYYNTGLVKTHIKSDSVVSTQTVLETRFGYNETGDLVSEKLSRTTNQGPLTYNYTHPTDLARNGDPLLFKLFDDSGLDQDGDPVTLVGFQVYNAAGEAISANAGSVTVTQSGDNYLEITPNGNLGLVRIEYTLRDDRNQTAVGSITLSVASTPPVANPYGIISTDTGSYVDVHATDLASDPDGGPQPLKFVRSQVSYTPNAGIEIEWLNNDQTMRVRGVTPTTTSLPNDPFDDPFDDPNLDDFVPFLSWTITDGAASVSGQTVVEVSQGAIGQNDTASLSYRGTALVNVLANDIVASGRSKTLVSVSSSNSSNLEARIENNRLRLTHKSGGAGSYTVNYSFSDGVATRSATVSVTVAANKAPTAGSYNLELARQGSTSRQVIFGQDADGHSVSIVNVTVLDGRGGELNASVSGNSIAITHISDNGTYRVRYQLRDQYGATSGYGYITVNVANIPPAAKNYGVIQTDTGAYVDINVSDLASDPDGAPEPLKFVRSMVGFPSDAGVQIQWLNGDRTMRVRGVFMTPNLVKIRDYPEPEWVPYKAFISWGVTDGKSTTSGQTQVKVSQGAIANPDSATLNYRGTKLVNVLSNDVAASNRSKTLTAVSSNSSNLGVQIQNNSIRLTHNSGSAGNYTVTYSFTDGVSTQTSTVAVTVNANRAPTANDYSVTLGRNASTSRQVIYYNDPDGHSVSITNISVLDGRGGEFTAKVDSDTRKIRLTHVSGHGTYKVQYRLKDQFGAYSPYKRITVTVAAPSNRAPIISNTNITVNRSNLIRDGVYSFGLAQYLTDPDGDTVRIKPGSVSTPNPSFFGASGSGTSINFWARGGSGSAVVSYTVEDQKGGEASGQITFNFTVAQTGGINLSAPTGGSISSATSLELGSISAASAQNASPTIIDVSTGTPTNGGGSGTGTIDVDWGPGGVGGITGGNYTPNTGALRNSTATYDALGRLTNWNEAGGVNTPAASKQLYYDANSNIRRSVSDYSKLSDHGGENGTDRTDHWFTYDTMNRVIVDKGVRSGDTVDIADGQGTRYQWNAVGERKTAFSKRTVTRSLSVPVGDIDVPPGQTIPTSVNHTWLLNATERYDYDLAGRLEGIELTANDAPEVLWYNTLTGAQIVNQPKTRQISNFEYNTLGQQTLQEDFTNNSSEPSFSQVTTYNSQNGRIHSTSTSTLRGGTTDTTLTTYYYGSYGSHVLSARDVPTGSVTATTTVHSNDDDGVVKRSETINSYTFYDSAVQNGVRHTDNISNSNKVTTTGFVLDGGGNTLRAVISDARNRTVNFTHDISGQVIERREADNLSGGDPRDIYYRFGGKEMGHITNNGGDYHHNYEQSVAGRTRTSGDPTQGAFYNGSEFGTARGDFDYSISRFTSYNQDSRAGSYTVRSGESLASIAQQQYGDSNLWYRIAQANGLSSAQAPLTEGQILRLPAGVTRSTYNASTFQPYDPSKALGDVNPGAPTPPKNKGKCGVFGQILLVVVAVAVTAVLSPVGTATFGQAVLAAAGGSLASQGVGLATGIQKKFSFKSLALSAVSAGVTNGIGPEGFLGGKTGLFGKGLEGAIARGALSSAITQGIGVATGLQDKFSFAGVAAAGVAAGVGNLLGGKLKPLSGDGAERTLKNIAGHIAVGAARSIASAATRSAIEGSSFSRALQAGLPDVIGQVVGQAIGGAVDGAFQARSSTRSDEPQEIAVLADGSVPIRIPNLDLEPVETPVITSGDLAEGSIEVRSVGNTPNGSVASALSRERVNIPLPTRTATSAQDLWELRGNGIVQINAMNISASLRDQMLLELDQRYVHHALDFQNYDFDFDIDLGLVSTSLSDGEFDFSISSVWALGEGDIFRIGGGNGSGYVDLVDGFALAEYRDGVGRVQLGWGLALAEGGNDAGRVSLAWDLIEASADGDRGYLRLGANYFGSDRTSLVGGLITTDYKSVSIAGVEVLDFGDDPSDGPFRFGEFVVDTHKNQPSPRPGFQGHHGLFSVWMRSNVEGYTAGDWPSILMTSEDHYTTNREFSAFRKQLRVEQGSSTVDWSKVSASRMRTFSEQAMVAANVPEPVRNEYWRRFNQMMQNNGSN
ncbi:LysM peptidoglycan-binding domain-containing protein [uncultured Erythrobacter sp.]|uniref:Ig-like domain-containing protein n=1 Tax=uncultured Erythrobacter sp. TaxID=263913 RepID=UPI0026386F20|nr:LysM peptidoglycan-binding domain-containing protein [uncultured Erythrobacter sp.]